MYNFQEKTMMCKIVDPQGHSSDHYLYIRFHAKNVLVTLTAKSQHYEDQEYDLPESLICLLQNFPFGTQLQLEHAVFVRKENHEMERVNLKETISLCLLRDTEGYFLKFHLQAEIEGVGYEAEDSEDFSQVLQKLSKKANVHFLVCATCKYADFMSYGGEDLRHNWSCFRDVEVDLSIPWFHREEAFDQAIPHVDALHWCPRYVLRTRW